MTDQPLLRIGPFSRASWLSIKALRAYHESGLLVPAAVDPETGYRLYSIDQLTDAAIIRQLRELDMPLAAIRQILDARDPAVTSKLLAEHAIVLEARLTSIRRAVDTLQRDVDTPELHTPIHRRHEPMQTVLTLAGTVTEADWEPFLVDAFTRLRDAAARDGAVLEGSVGACYPDLVEDDAQDLTVFVPVSDGPAPLLSSESRRAGISVGELPATDVAVLTHRGDYGDLPDAYRQLGSWVATNASPRELPVRELYRVGLADLVDPDEYRTEICWPVEPENSR